MVKCYAYNNCNHIDCSKEYCPRKYKLDYLYNESLIPEYQRKHVDIKIDGDGTDKEEFTSLSNISNTIVEFVESGENLYIHSTQCGNGKSTWALRLIESYFNKIWAKTDLKCRALFINVPRFLLALKDNISEKNDYITHIKEYISDVDLVVWDDIGNKATTVFESEHLLSMIENRLSNGKSNIFTSNLNNEEMHQALGDRLYSRICNMSYDIELKGKDKRFLGKEIKHE